MQPKINYPYTGCSDLSYNMQSDPFGGWHNGWMNNAEFLIKCSDQKLKLYGIGLSGIRSTQLNIAKNGLIQIINADFECTMSKIYACGAISSTTQLIYFEGEKNHIISGTVFEFCGINPYHYDKPSDWDPSLIQMKGKSTNSFSNIKFTHPMNGTPQAWELCPTRPIKIEEGSKLDINTGEFYNSSCTTKGSFLLIGSSDDVTVSQVTFTECVGINNNEKSKSGQAIWITNECEGTVKFDLCKFVDCGKNNTGHVIYTEASKLIVSNCHFNFTNTNSSGCIRCANKGEYTFESNIFYNAKTNGGWTGVGIFYEGGGPQDVSEGLSINGNTFDFIQGYNQGRCLSLNIKDGGLTVLNHNVVQNSPPGHFCVKIMHRKVIDNFTMNNWQFINNQVDEKNGGGAGIWIQNYSPDDVSTEPLIFIVTNCEFINNRCLTKGGAFQVGSNDPNSNDLDKYVTRIELQITGCTFRNNTASDGGGALAIQTNLPLTIKGCHFENNKSPEIGGAIYIETVVDDNTGSGHQMPNATIFDCHFIGNSGRQAHCIYIKDGPKTSFSISNCEFKNNYDETYQSGSCILSNAFELSVSVCHFINDDLEHSSGGVNITSCCILEVIESKFVHCNAGSISKSYGGGIGYANINGDQSRDESITIKDCTFDGNGGSNGVAIGLKPLKSYPAISNVEINNHVLTSWIFFIFFQFETEGDFELNNVNFNGNSFDSSKYSEFGGGTGIWIAESEDINYLESFNLVFTNCKFENNYSPENGGAISYGGSPRLQCVELTFNNCIFEHNRCNHYFGGACRFETNKPVSLIECTFNDNTAERESSTGGSGGGAVFIGSSVESVLISKCNFRNCRAYRGSFIFTNGAMDDINISNCEFSDLTEDQANSVYIEVDSQITKFVFDQNTFTELECIGSDGGAGLHIYNGADCTVSNCEFIKCKGKDENSGVIKLDSAVNSNSYLIFDSCVFSYEEEGGGNLPAATRPIYIEQQSLVQFNSCQFLSYKGVAKGTILYSKAQSSTIFFNCSFASLTGNCLMFMQEALSADIFDCQFTSCDVVDSLIIAEKAVNFTALNNFFSKDNDAIRFGPYVKNGLISNNTFLECSTKKDKGGALYIDGESLDVEIKDNVFTKCTGTDNGLAIYIADKVANANIHDCTFTNNNKPQSFPYTIYSLAGNLIFTDSIIEYDDENLHGCGIKIENPIKAEITNIEFRKLHRPSAIYVTGGSNDNNVIVYNCSFIGFRPQGNPTTDKKYSAFYFDDGINIDFYNNTVSNNQNSGSHWENLLIGYIPKRIDNCTFTGNRVDGKSGGGGAGIVFAGTNVQVTNCYFYNNEAKLNEASGGTGGAIQFGSNQIIEIDHCNFHNNRADCEGGALSIGCLSAYIHDSTFTNNYAAQQNFGNSTTNNKMGGAVFFNPSGTGNYTLSNCIFRSNAADQNGHAVFISGEANVYISDLCLFEDNSRGNGGSQIFISGTNSNLDFSNSTVCLKNQTAKSRGIELLDGHLYAHDTTFTNIEASKQGDKAEGNAILVSRGNNIAKIEDNLFKDCYIQTQLSYAVTFDGKELDFVRNTFDFSPNKGCGCLRIYTTGKINVENNIFQNSKVYKARFHGVFVYEETHRTTDKENTVIKFNTFQRCTSSQTACFQFKWISQDYDFIDNTFQNNNLDNYLGEFDFMGKKINGKFYCGRNKFINNTAKSNYGGGTGLWFQNKPSANEFLIENHYTIILDGCEFNGNHAVDNINKYDTSRKSTNGNGGALQIGWSNSVSNVDVEIINSLFINNIADSQGGALAIHIIGYTMINNCTFEGNVAGQKPGEPDRVFGGAIWAWPDFDYVDGHYSVQNNGTSIYADNVTIINSKFVNNRAKDATAVYLQSSEHTDLYIIDSQFVDNYNDNNKNFSIVSSAKEFIFENSTIKFSNMNKATSGIRTARPTKIFYSHFIKNSLNEFHYGEAVRVENYENEIEIADSVFEDCGNDGRHFYAVEVNSKIANIHDNVFNYTTTQYAGGAVDFSDYCDISFCRNRITNSRCWGAFNYEPARYQSKNNERIMIEGCTFEKCEGGNYRCLYIIAGTENITFSSNTIQDCSRAKFDGPGYLFDFELKLTSITEFTLYNITFKNLNTASNFGGGSGGWIQHSRKYKLIFKDCTFENNHAIKSGIIHGCENGKGGALQYGWSKTISNVDLTIDGCKFIKNVADQEGGALCLMIQGNIEIVDCIFTDNKAGAITSGCCGGAIAIIPEYGSGIIDSTIDQQFASDSININTCTFSGNIGHDANAIYVSRGPRTDLIINENCKFLDNTNESSIHSTIMAETRKLEVDDSSFDFTSLSKSCNAITTNATTLSIDNVKFTKCALPKGHGSALIIREGTTSCNIENSRFIDNGNNKQGCVIYTEASSFVYQRNVIDFTSMSISDRGIYIHYSSKFHLYDSVFHYCKTSQGGTGASFHYKGIRKAGYTEDISFNNVTFDNNSCPYASCFFMEPSSSIPIMRNIKVLNHKDVGNFITVIVFKSNLRQDITLEKWTFDNNLYNRAGENKKEDCGGSGLWIAPAEKSAGYKDSFKLIFDTCVFKNNRNNLCGGAFTYGYSDTLRYIFVNMNDCTFENNLCDGEKGGALCFNGQVPVTIERSVFRGNKVSSGSYKGHCIYIDRRCKAIISETQFIDNGLFGKAYISQKKHPGQSIIQCSGAQLDLNKCNMTFSDPTIINSRCIDIDYQSVVNLINSTFSNVNVKGIWGGALHLKKNETSIIDEQITIDSCVFDNNDADNGCSGLFWATSVPTLNNLTFLNEPNNKYVFCIFFEAFRDTCTVGNTVFENGTSPDGEDGGGSAIWIANIEEISHGRPFELTFHNCTWRNNAGSKRGGAIHYGTSKTLVGVQMTFEQCHFIGNHARTEGGAVSLVTKSPIVFSDCTFRNNYVESAQTRDSTSGKGGSISINSKTPLVQINGCSFTNETSAEGNAIFIHNNVQACLISGSTFNNCGKEGTVIVSETIEFMLQYSEIKFDRRGSSCRALQIRTISVTTISQSKFIRCRSNEVGGGIYLNNTLQSEEQEDFTLEDCTFDDCASEVDGSALFLNVSSSPVLRGVTFQNNQADRNISTILNYNDFQDLFSIQSCKFINNKFQNTRLQDGGGCAMFIANCKQSLESLYKLSFEDCTWSKNTAAYGGAFSYGNSNLVKNVEHVFERCTFTSNLASNNQGGALYLSTTQLILLDECTFNDNECHSDSDGKQGGAIYIAKCSSVSITGSTFTSNDATNGHAIFIEDIPSANIFGCTFDSNTNGKRQGSQIASRCAELVLYDTTIKFDPKQVPCRGIEIIKKCSTTFVNCKFLNCNITGQIGGAICIREDLATNRTEALTIDNCLFDKCDSNNGAVINAIIGCNPTIRGCTVSNCNGGHYVFCIFFNAVPAQTRFVHINDCTFEGNYFAGASTSDAGGIGLWIAYREELSSEELTLNFNNCNFINNRCGKNGGAFAYGESKTLKNISLQFTECTFKDNTCNGGRGGALYLSTKKPISISDCNFINNKCSGANTNGGAIYIDSPSEKVHILDSIFEGGQSIDGVGVYSGSLTNNLVIEGTSFTNCASASGGSVVFSKASIFNIQQTDIVFDLETNVKCRGIYLVDKAKALLSNVQLINCHSTVRGGGMHIDFSTGNREESLEIRDVTIQNPNAMNGCAIMAQLNIAPTLERITIRNSTSGQYVIAIFFKQYVYETKVSHCTFEYNQFENKAFPPLPDAGGSGIWIANDGKRDDDKDKRLIFEDCTWLGNRVKDTSSLKYGGAFALGTSLTTKQTELVFTSCRFIKNYAQERGGGLYLSTSLPVTLSRCLFDENEAADGSNIYTETTSNVTIEYTQIVRGKSTQNGAAYIKSSHNLQMLNVTFSENTGPTATSLYLENEGVANIDQCNFDFSRSSNQYQIRLHGESSSASITFRSGCFVHSGDSNGNTHIYSTHKGAVNLPAGNCFDTSQSIAINNQGGSINAGSGIFDCTKCGNIYVPTIAPHPTPTASQAVETSGPSDIPSQIPTTSTSSSQSGGTSSSKKKNAKKIAMIAGITAAIVVVIVVIIILIWLFVFRKRSAAADNNSDNASEMNDEQITEISGIDPTGGADDPIWAGTNQDNPLFNGGDDQDEDQMIHNDFEESWGDSVI